MKTAMQLAAILIFSFSTSDLGAIENLGEENIVAKPIAILSTREGG